MDLKPEDQYLGYDISFLTSMRIRQEQKNLEKYLKILSKQRERTLAMCDYQKEQTELDLELRIKKCSTQLSELSARSGRKEGIAMARKESLGVLRLHNGRTWNTSTNTYHTKSSVAKERPGLEKSLSIPQYDPAVRFPSIEHQDCGHVASKTEKLVRSKSVDLPVTSSVKLPKLGRQ